MVLKECEDLAKKSLEEGLHPSKLRNFLISNNFSEKEVDKALKNINRSELSKSKSEIFNFLYDNFHTIFFAVLIGSLVTILLKNPSYQELILPFSVLILPKIIIYSLTIKIIVDLAFPTIEFNNSWRKNFIIGTLLGILSPFFSFSLFFIWFISIPIFLFILALLTGLYPFKLTHSIFMLILLFGITAIYDILFFFLLNLSNSNLGISNFIEILNNTMNSSNLVNETV